MSRNVLKDCRLQLSMFMTRKKIKHISTTRHQMLAELLFCRVSKSDEKMHGCADEGIGDGML